MQTTDIGLIGVAVHEFDKDDVDASMKSLYELAPLSVQEHAHYPTQMPESVRHGFAAE